MTYVYHYLFSAMWLIWLLYWWVMSYKVKATTRHESWSSRLLRFAIFVVVVLLMAPQWTPFTLLDLRFLPWAAWVFWVGAVLTAAGLLFTVWARLHLGMNWSATVTLKQDHELITSGPYAMVRHPIYTGLLLAFAGSTFARGEVRAVLALTLLTLAFWLKLRHEERWMREQFGAAYQTYSERVAALVPYVL